MHSFGLHSPNISFPAVTQKGACSDCIVHSFAFHYLLDEMQILVDMRHMTSNGLLQFSSGLGMIYWIPAMFLECRMLLKGSGK